jgi:site-specific DNA-methyltransferase (adenine-specific)
MADNTLYYGDNLNVLREHIPDEFADLIYLDPPFNSNADYNVSFQEKDGTRAAAQIKAFGDTWHWDQAAARAFQEVVEGGEAVSRCLQAFRTQLGENDMLAYLAMMAPRLLELRRVLKKTGSIYLHCDPTASHYLKLLMDAVFEPRNFLSEIIWKRTHAHGGAKRYGPVHDVLLFYAKGDDYKWIGAHIPYEEKYLANFFRFQDENGRRFRATILTGSGIRGGSSGKPWRGVDPTEIGRHWAVPGYVRHLLPNPDVATVQDALDQLDKIGRVLWPKKEKGTPSFKQYIDDLPGAPIQDVWTDIPPISAKAAERLGYPTQKPEALLERIISASSNEGDLVLDPFCGCGTATASSQKLNRKWVGIDITHLTISLIKHRLTTAFGEGIDKSYRIVGEPEDLSGAAQLAADDPYQFQWWALSLVRARPSEQKKGADKGIDGRLYFHDEGPSKTKQVIFSVKAGHTNVSHVRDLRGVLDREKAQIGVLLTMQESTQPMRTEAASAGYYKSGVAGYSTAQYPRLQILTVKELLDGRKVDMPLWHVQRTFRDAPRATGKLVQDAHLPFEPETE